MSEPEDERLLLDEIKALEDVLAEDEASDAFLSPEKSVAKHHNLLNSTRRANPQLRGFGEVTPYNETVSTNESEISDCPKSALEANRKLLEILQETKRELVSMLEKCVENKSIVEERIKERAKNTKSSKILIGTAGMPYFKDAKQYVAPRNEDAMRKTQNGELQVVHLRYTSPWTARDRNILWKAIRHEASSATLETGERDESEPGGSCNTGAATSKRWNLPKNFKAMVGPVGHREFDWMKIAAMDFDNRHTAEECRVMWRVFLHPDINRYRWTKEEDEGINRLSKIYNYQDWDRVALDLSTSRSGYQCFIRFNTNNQLLCLKDTQWSPSEDLRLQECVERFKIGHYVPWGTVSKYMVGRSKMQVYFRWKYNAAPHLKKGRFTPEEDAMLLEAVKKHSRNFSKIATFEMPNRTSAQLSDHYSTLLQRERGIRNSWSINDDTKLLKLYKKFGADWSRIAEKLTGKTRTQIRHRHKAILRHWERGVSIHEIPREEKVQEDCEEEIEILEKLERDKINRERDKKYTEVEKVDMELLKYFRIAPPVTTPGRKQKCYRQEELDDMTKKLYINLKTLNANLIIPEELDDRSLSEKDKQLLTSLRDYTRHRANFLDSRFQSLKSSRITTNVSSENSELHFAPLCSGDCNRNERPRFNHSINYVVPNYLHCCVSLNYVFETPSNVLDLISQEENENFNFLTKLLSTKTPSEGKSNTLRKVYVLGPEVCGNALVKLAEKPENNSTILENPQSVVPSARRAKKARGGYKGKSWESSVAEGVVRRADGSVDCLEPNYHTLLGLQHIIASQDDASESSEPSGDIFVSKEGRKAMETFKKRLFQLFKYPIGLSHVLRPEIYVKKTPGVEAVNDQLIDDDFSKPPSPKKRKIYPLGRKRAGGK